MSASVVMNARLVLSHGIEAGALVVRDGLIAEVATGVRVPAVADCGLVVDAGGLYLAPGLIDIHVHGGGGFSLMTDELDEVRAYARWVAGRGVTGFLVSTSGRDHGEIVARLRALRRAVGVEAGAARVLGFHLEGPYINPVRKGAFDPRWLRAPNVDEYRELSEAAGGEIRQVTLAPELPGADALIDAVLASGATSALGHSDATYDEAMRAFERGVSHVTHCFNAMRPFGHRDPGCLGAIMTSDVTAELIGDGAHVDYAAARVLLRAKGTGKVVLITDGMPLAGTEDGESAWEGVQIRVEGGKAVRARDGTIIGGVITLDQTLRNAVASMGMPLHDACAMASTNAAATIGLGGRFGKVAVGYAADFVLLDDALQIAETWVGGDRVYAR